MLRSPSFCALKVAGIGDEKEPALRAGETCSGLNPGKMMNGLNVTECPDP